MGDSHGSAHEDADAFVRIAREQVLEAMFSYKTSGSGEQCGAAFFCDVHRGCVFARNCRDVHFLEWGGRVGWNKVRFRRLWRMEG